MIINGGGGGEGIYGEKAKNRGLVGYRSFRNVIFAALSFSSVLRPTGN